MSLVITPSTGRRVLFFLGSIPTSGPVVNEKKAPFDAGVAYVHSIGNTVPGDPLAQASTINVGFIDHNGAADKATSVRLYDRPQTTSDEHGKGESYAVWMPYQFEQALRALQPKQSAPGRAADVALTKLEDNGVETDDGAARRLAAHSEAEQQQDDTARAVGEAG
jgi:hypothetical protein